MRYKHMKNEHIKNEHMKYKHIVFDADGTLLDTEYAILLSLQDTVKVFLQKDMEFDALRFSLGIPGDATLAHLEIKESKREDAFNHWVDKLNEYYDSVKVFDGMRQVLDALKEQGCILGVVTSKNRKLYDHEFAHLNIIDYFRTSICQEDSKEHKPTPGPLLAYMEAEQVAKEDIIYIGDSTYDGMCAHGAGVDFALAVWGSHTKEIPAQYYPETPEELLEFIMLP